MSSQNVIQTGYFHVFLAVFTMSSLVFFMVTSSDSKAKLRARDSSVASRQEEALDEGDMSTSILQDRDIYIKVGLIKAMICHDTYSIHQSEVDNYDLLTTDVRLRLLNPSKLKLPDTR